ncbi:hypothetical protein [Stygiobacter electus]|uniref:Uncharacterized protein n=1 Tax=Stygiobacter electus TaxID=3032292 RepID=A0AAE3P1N9_9BACT|nr:hypothetical protein [Stygiobacter electus]MDF1612444.1 hypothetical protein [Stygiobacter electus]
MQRGQKNISNNSVNLLKEKQNLELLDFVTTELRIKISLDTKTNGLILCRPYF